MLLGEIPKNAPAIIIFIARLDQHRLPNPCTGENQLNRLVDGGKTAGSCGRNVMRESSSRNQEHPSGWWRISRKSSWRGEQQEFSKIVTVVAATVNLSAFGLFFF
uniref:Uncharacterized protein n=1 Tax=Oryza punctata TaxID=4537 RepID=A0A0E0M9K8_ORYPU